jgi:histidinol-phosphatase (PHP family)
LELNFLGMREHRNYPDERFWRLAGKEGAPVTFGCDAHHPAAAFDAISLQKARAMVQQYHLNYIGKPRLKPLG